MLARLAGRHPASHLADVVAYMVLLDLDVGMFFLDFATYPSSSTQLRRRSGTVLRVATASVEQSSIALAHPTSFIFLRAQLDWFTLRCLQAHREGAAGNAGRGSGKDLTASAASASGEADGSRDRRGSGEGVDSGNASDGAGFTGDQLGQWFLCIEDE
ncbi:unnamed protein product [Cutaneotrichosporon oleaginosum]